VFLKEGVQHAAALRVTLEVIELENGVKVPHAEIVLEGYIHPQNLLMKGLLWTSAVHMICQEAACDLYHKNITQHDPIYHRFPAGSEHHIMMGIV